MSTLMDTIRKVLGLHPEPVPMDLPENLPENSRLIRAVEMQSRRIQQAKQLATDEANARRYQT